MSSLIYVKLLKKNERIKIKRIVAAWGSSGSFKDDGEKYVQISESGIPNVRAASVDKNGSVWMATDGGVFKGTKNGCERVQMGWKRHNPKGIRTVAVVNETVWVGGTAGLYSIDSLGRNKKIRTKKNEPLPNRSIRSLAADGDGGVALQAH